MVDCPPLNNLGSLITYSDPRSSTERCLGFLLHFAGRGVFDAAFGRVEVTPEQSETHNTLLSEAMLKGLDESCEVGQHGTFYWNKREDGRYVIKTFTGTVVSEDVTTASRSITFRRKGKAFRGRLSSGKNSGNVFNFQRIS